MQDDAATHIVGLIEASIRVHDSVVANRPDLRKEMGEWRWRDQCQFATISMPRQTGHTTAALEVLRRYSNSVLIPNSYQTADRLQKQFPELSSQILHLEKATERGGRSALHVISRLKGGLEVILIDGTRITEEQIDLIFILFSPKLVIYLGDFERTQ